MVGCLRVSLASSPSNVSSIPTPVATTRILPTVPGGPNHPWSRTTSLSPARQHAHLSRCPSSPSDAPACLHLLSIRLRGYPNTTDADPICSQVSPLLVITSRVALCSLSSQFPWTTSMCILTSPPPSEVTVPVICPLCSLLWHNIHLKGPSLVWMSPTLILSIPPILDPQKEIRSRSQLLSSVKQQLERAG